MDKERYGIARARTNQTEHEVTWPRKCVEPCLEGDHKSKKGKQPTHFQSTNRTKTFITRTVLACNQLCICAAVCAWCLIRTMGKIRNREEPEVSEADLTMLTHRIHLTASGDRMRDSENSKTFAQVSQEAGFSAKVGKGQYFATRSSRKNGGTWTLVCRESTHHLAVIQTRNFARTIFSWSRDAIETSCPGYSRLSDTRFGALSCWRTRPHLPLWRNFSQPGETLREPRQSTTTDWTNKECHHWQSNNQSESCASTKRTTRDS